MSGRSGGEQHDTTAPVTGADRMDVIVNWLIENDHAYKPVDAALELMESLESAGLTIAPRGDVLTAEMRAAIGRSCDLHMAHTHFSVSQMSKQATTEEQDSAWENFDRARKAFTPDDFKVCRKLATRGTT